MKRSEINAIMREADAFIRGQGFYLPPFAYWPPDAWRQRGPDARELVAQRLGWDITDFGKGDYRHEGLFLFTLRNGPADGRTPQDKPYAEKIMVADVDQVTPLHFHWRKMEDIINRGGGELVIELYNATGDERLSGDEVRVCVDGVWHALEAGGRVTLRPGESITLAPRCYHRFWAAGARTLVGEVSTVNDDRADNRFYEAVGRFPDVEEDEPPLYLLCNDYPRYYTRAG